MRTRRLAATLLAVAVLAGLAGCSDNPASDEPSEETTAGTAPDAPAQLTKENFAKEITAAQTQAGSAHVEAKISGSLAFDISGDIAGFGDPSGVKMDMTAAIQGEPVQMLLLDKIMYIKGEQFAPAGKEWLKVDLSDPSNPLAQLLDSANPSTFTAYLQGITKFDEVGVETVDGVQTRHYTVTVDTAKMLAANPMFKGQEASTLGLPPELTSEVYVDREQHPVLMQADLGTAGQFGVHFSDYGKDVTVTPPDPSTVGEFSL